MGNEPRVSIHWFVRLRTTLEKSRVAIVLTGLLMLLLFAATAYRTYSNYSPPSSEFDWERRGLSDFHYGAYYPSLAFRNRINPYSLQMMEEYPVSSPARIFPPITFVVHLPFTLFDLHTADVLFFIYNCGLLMALSAMVVCITRGRFHWLWFFGLTCILLVSRPGHITLFTGYFTLEFVLATLCALHFARSRPWLAAFGVLIASGKPTFVLPLLVLLIAGKNYRTAILGIILSTAAGLGGLGWLALDNGFSHVVEGIAESQEAFDNDETEFPINTWTRIDIMGMAAKPLNWVPDNKAYLLGMFVLLAGPCLILRILDKAPILTGASGNLAVLAILLTIYHQTYDCLLLVVPFFGLFFFQENLLPRMGRRSKCCLWLLLSIPFINYVSTQSFQGILGLEQYDLAWQIITVVNGVCLTLAMLILVVHCWQLSVYQSIQKDFGRSLPT